MIELFIEAIIPTVIPSSILYLPPDTGFSAEYIKVRSRPCWPEIQAKIAREAYRDFGKGSGHPAQLNFGDCFAYALAKLYGEPLLFKGRDFIHTDIVSALPSKL